MKFIRILGGNIRDSFKSVFRNFSLSLASISCITITLVVVALAVIISENVNNFAELVEGDVTIVTFLDVSITQEEIDNVEEEINKLNYIETYSFQSKQDVTNEMMDSSETWSDIMKEWDIEDNPLQPTFQVKVTEIAHIGDVAKKIKEIPGVDAVKYGEGLIEKLINVFNVIEKISIGTVIALILVTAFLISNTIKITIFSRRTEIEIMRLVGASNINIKIPFILEGLFLGVIGSIIPVIFTTYGYVFLYDNFNFSEISPFLQFIQPTPFIYLVSFILIGIGILVGMFGSWRAVKKHLKV
ncbi:MAG: permease-like cell division protein FtsX [Bacilli bacterium]|nr:permease-like cell division protein FtsX [Bacilli bacterium]MDD4733462.1 permease-like cell division protein FtsX [Bacilli bacterium]